MERTLRIERLLISSSALDDAGVLNTQTLVSALRLESRLTDYLSSTSSRCLTSRNKQCISLSPLEFWSHDERSLAADEHISETLNARRNISVAGLPLTPPMVLAGRESNEHSSSSVDFALFLSLLYLFHEDDCNGSSGHNIWVKALQETVAASGDLTLQQKDPLLLALAV